MSFFLPLFFSVLLEEFRVWGFVWEFVAGEEEGEGG